MTKFHKYGTLAAGYLCVLVGVHALTQDCNYISSRCRSMILSTTTVSTTTTAKLLGGLCLRRRNLGIISTFSNSNDNDETTATTSKANNLPLTTVFLGSFATVTVASLGYAQLFYQQHQSLSSSSIMELIGKDLGMGMVVTVLAGVYLKLWTTLVKIGVLDPKDSRKIIHTGSAPLFMLFWPFFSMAPWSRVFAATVPLINVFRLVTAGSSDITNSNKEEQELALAVSRSGNSKEALEGPLIYCIITVITTLIFWRDSMTGVMALSTMAAGDGMADLVGRRLGKYTGSWPISNGTKSYAGTIAFFVSSAIVSLSLAAWLGHFGILPPDDGTSNTVWIITAICFICSLVEVIPFGDDNWTVPITAAILASIFL